MQSTTNRDVWSEILQYFKVDLADDSREDIRLNRSVILSVALIHPDLVDVALDELWRAMVSLEPIVHVLNASLVESPKTLEYDQLLEFWVSADCPFIAHCLLTNCFAKELSLPMVNATDPFSRARVYLSRIQYLHFATFPAEREYTLWAAISTLGRQLSPLCPRLRTIFFGSGFDTPGAIYNLMLLISPSLQNLIFANTVSDESKVAAIPTLLSSFRCHNVQLQEFSYHGFVSPRIIQHIPQFPTLRSVAIRPGQPIREGIQFQSFRRMENLTKLDIHLGIFQTGANDWLTHMPSLLTLCLAGSWKDIYACIHDRTYSSLQSLSLILDPVRGRANLPQPHRMNRHVFSRISAACPSLQSLSLTLPRSQPGHVVMAILDILALRGRPLEILELRHLPASLSTTDIIDIVTVWLSLKRLRIVPPPAHLFECEAKVLFSYLANHAPKLLDIDVPLDFSSLTTPLLSLPRCACPLQKLDLSQALNVPETLPEKLTLCRNFISVLPRLTIVTSSGSDPDVPNDLQAIINLLQDILNSSLRRHDLLF